MIPAENGGGSWSPAGLFTSYSYKIEDYDFNLINEKYNVSKQFYANHKGLGDILLNKIVTKSNSFALRNSNEVIESYEELKQIENILETELGFDYSLCDKYLIGYSDIVKMIDKWDTRIDYLRNWSYLLTIYEKLQNNNLKCIIDYIESDNYDYSKNQLALIYQKSVYKHIMNEIVLNNNSGSFNAIELKHSSDTYKELINVFANETVKETARALRWKSSARRACRLPPARQHRRCPTAPMPPKRRPRPHPAAFHTAPGGRCASWS